MPLEDFFFEAGHDFRVLVGEVGGFVGIILDAEEAGGNFVPFVNPTVGGGVLAGVAEDELPFVFEAPEILQGVVGFSGSHVVDGMGHTEDGITFFGSFGVEEIESGEVGGGF